LLWNKKLIINADTGTTRHEEPYVRREIPYGVLKC